MKAKDFTISSTYGWKVKIGGQEYGIDHLPKGIKMDIADYELARAMYRGSYGYVCEALKNGADKSITMQGSSLLEYNRDDKRECRLKSMEDIEKLLQD